MVKKIKWYSEPCSHLISCWESCSFHYFLPSNHSACPLFSSVSHPGIILIPNALLDRFKASSPMDLPSDQPSSIYCCCPSPTAFPLILLRYTCPLKLTSVTGNLLVAYTFGFVPFFSVHCPVSSSQFCVSQPLPFYLLVFVLLWTCLYGHFSRLGQAS